MTIVTVQARDRAHEIHIEGEKVLKWVGVVGETKIQMKIQMSRPYKVYEDKKGRFIKLRCDEVAYKHYLK